MTDQPSPSRVRAVLIDLDGVLYEGEQPVPGARDAIDWLVARAIPHLFLTNTTSRSREAVLAKLQKLGFRFGAEAILTPPIAARHWLERQGIERILPLVPDTTLEEFASFQCREPGDEVSAVIVGDMGERWNYQLLNGAFRSLMAEPAPVLIALGMTRYWRAEDGLRLDTAPFVHCLSHAVDREPLVLGKPAREFFRLALQLLDTAAEHTLMIGDDIRADVGGAQAAGLNGALVRTGKFQRQDLDGDIWPDLLLDSLADLPHWWRQGQHMDTAPD